eukprot:scaffold75626_cov21-Tisochrysis_lutea.AAC.2
MYLAQLYAILREDCAGPVGWGAHLPVPFFWETGFSASFLLRCISSCSSKDKITGVSFNSKDVLLPNVRAQQLNLHKLGFWNAVHIVCRHLNLLNLSMMTMKLFEPP